jgi:DNA invertase Pin-like site-specific DNA recombinase
MAENALSERLDKYTPTGLGDLPSEHDGDERPKDVSKGFVTKYNGEDLTDMTKGEIVGYARVSTEDQHLDRQIAALEAAGCTKIFEDSVSGRTMHRDGWERCVEYLRPGDHLLVTEMDRIGRSTLEVVGAITELNEQGITVQTSSGMVFDPRNAIGALVVSVLAAVAQLEVDLKAERQAAARAVAKKNGTVYGRPPAILPEDYEAVQSLLDTGWSVSRIAKRFLCSRASVYRALEKMEEAAA